MYERSPILAVDIDECLSDTYPLMVRVGQELGYRLHDSSEYHPRGWFNVEGAALAELQELIDTRLHQAGAVDGAASVMVELHNTYTLIALTGRSATRHGAATEEFLQRHFPNMFTRIVYADQEGLNMSKGALARSLGVAALIEDLPVYVHDVATHGVPVVYLNRNQAWQHTVHHPLVREVRHWREVPETLATLCSESAVASAVAILEPHGGR